MIRASSDSLVWSEISTEIKDVVMVVIESQNRLNVLKNTVNIAGKIPLAVQRDLSYFAVKDEVKLCACRRASGSEGIG